MTQGRVQKSGGLTPLISLVLIVALGWHAVQVWAQAAPSRQDRGELSPTLLRAAQEAYQQAKQQQLKLRPLISPLQKPGQIPPPSDWDALGQLRVRDRVVCRTRDGLTHRGRFLAVSSESITLKIGKRDVGFRREQVLTVKLLSRDRRAMFALVGAAAGLGVLVLHGAAKDESPSAAAFVAGTLLPAVGGGLVGRPRKTTIYRANP